MCRLDRVKAHGIIESRFDMSRSPWSSAVKIADTDRKRLYSSFKIRSYRSCDHAELILIRRFYANHRIGTEHIRPDVKRGSWSERRNICLVRRHRFDYRIDKPFFGKHRHFQPSCRISHTGRIQIRAESHDAPILGRVSLHSLKYGLRILQHAGTFVDGHHRIFRHPAFVPCAVLIIGYISFIRFYIVKANIRPV